MTQDKNNTNQTAPNETGEIKSPTNTTPNLQTVTSNEESNKRLEELAAENEKLKKENAVLKLNIKEEYRDDAISLAENLVNGECDFTQALNNVIAKYPQFITTTTQKLNLGGPTGGLHITTNDRDAFVSGVKNKFLGG